MALELSSLDIHYAVSDLSRLQGAKVEKIYQSDVNKRDLYFQFYCKDGGKLALRFMLPGLICTPKEKPVYPQLPPGFAMFLRKYLGGTRVENVEQQGFDRIMRITFASKTDKYTLLVEFLAPGNMLLLDKENKIINLLENQQFKDRTLRGKATYSPPPASFDIIGASDEELTHHLTMSTRESIVTTLAIHCSLGGIYAEEACVRAGLAKQRSDLKPDEIQQVITAIRSLFSQPISAHADAGRAYPFALQSKTTIAVEETSFLNALTAFIQEDAPLTKLAAKQRDRSSPTTKLQMIIDAQKKQVTRFEEEVWKEQRKGELLFEQYQEVKALIDAAKHAREKKNDLNTALKSIPGFVSYNDKNAEMIIELKTEEDAA